MLWHYYQLEIVKNLWMQPLCFTDCGHGISTTWWCQIYPNLCRTKYAILYRPKFLRSFYFSMYNIVNYYKFLAAGILIIVTLALLILWVLIALLLRLHFIFLFSQKHVDALLKRCLTTHRLVASTRWLILRERLTALTKATIANLTPDEEVFSNV